MQNNGKKKKLVIVPAHNEQENIGQVVARIREQDQEIDVVVIDDGSSDRTARHAWLAGARVINLSSNMGYGVALQTGYKYAFENGYDYVVQLDGDGQHDPAYIPELLKMVTSGEADMVLGSRFIKERSSGEVSLRKYKASLARKMGIGLFAFLTTKLVGLKVTDPTSGYQALNRYVIAFFTRDFFPCDFPDADVIVMVHRAGFKIKELPMAMYERKTGKSMHSGLKPIYYVFKMFLSMFMTLIRKRSGPFYEKSV
jgi:glycosyltransferase involved in cell wall biosynthesis